MSGTLSAAVSLLAVQLKFKLLMELSTAAGTAAILWFGARAAMGGELTVGAIVLFLSYLSSLYVPLRTVMYTGSTIQSAGGGARRVMEILRVEPEVVDRRDARRLGPVRGSIVFEDVSFGYEAGRPILRGISLEVKPGETVALVGATGAGKSTLVGLIPRFFDPAEGRVLIDGHDLREVQLSSLRSQVALVLQEPFLFPLTIAENIAYGRPDASAAEIEAAARAANAHDFVSRLPQGYDTVIGERGATLSGGERQRLSIARALLKNAPVLILDEPTSALDAGTEALIMQAMRNLVSGRTTFIIAHRLATVRNADRIVVLDNGRMAESGTHQQLVARGGLYARLSALQFGSEIVQ
jgi:ATP-binding cassette subfamily B protein/subfamily B ATP-binding cassette protein MsbA